MTFNAFEDETLVPYISSIASYDERHMVNKIVEYSNDPRESFGHVLVLYGLRRSGKTTAMFQAIKRLGVDKCLYIICNKDTDIKEMFEFASRSPKVYIFIDEVTLIDDFILNSSELADIVGGQKRCVVLSGTDSFSFLLAKDELFDRRRTIHTLPISLYDYKNTLHLSTIEEFIRYCGTMDKPFDDIVEEYKTLRDYIANAIVKNIEYSYEHSIERDMSPYAHWIGAVFVQDAHDLVISASKRCIHIPEFAATYKKYKKQFDNPEVFYMYVTDRSLRKLDLLADLKEFVPDLKMLSLNVTSLLRDCDIFISVNVKNENGHTVGEKNCIFFSRLRYCMTNVLLATIKDITKAPEEFITEIKHQILGLLLEDLIMCFIYNSQRFHGDLEVFKLRTTDGLHEVDVVVHDKKDNVYDLYEVKYSSKRKTDFCKHLFVDYPFMKNIRNRYVIYNGETYDTGSVKYVNAFEFLSSPAFRRPQYITM